MQGFWRCFFLKNHQKNPLQAVYFACGGRPVFLTNSAGAQLHGFAGALAEVCTHTFHLCGVLGHGLFGGLEHIITVVGHGLADGAGLGLGGGDDLRRALLGRLDDLRLADEDCA